MSHHYVNRCTFTVDDCSAQYKLIPPYSHRVWDGATHYVSGRVLLQSLRLRTCDGSDNRIHKGSTEPNPIRVTMVVLLFFCFSLLMPCIRAFCVAILIVTALAHDIRIRLCHISTASLSPQLCNSPHDHTQHTCSKTMTP